MRTLALILLLCSPGLVYGADAPDNSEGYQFFLTVTNALGKLQEGRNEVLSLKPSASASDVMVAIKNSISACQDAGDMVAKFKESKNVYIAAGAKVMEESLRQLAQVFRIRLQIFKDNLDGKGKTPSKAADIDSDLSIITHDAWLSLSKASVLTLYALGDGKRINLTDAQADELTQNIERSFGKNPNKNKKGEVCNLIAEKYLNFLSDLRRMRKKIKPAGLKSYGNNNKAV